MNTKSINSKLDFLENLIVEMNPVNLEELKNLCLEQITEIHYELQLQERARFIYSNTTADIDSAYSLAKIECSYRRMLGVEIDTVTLFNIRPTLGTFNDLAYRLSVKDTISYKLPKIGESISFESENKKVVYDKPESKYFSKPKNNFKKL
ncbi:hypothetical protein [Flavobacterium phage FL-1]|nr:hypothetical protein [Flavobacterium phage FL-1]